MIEGHGMDSFAFRFRLGRVFFLAVALFLLVSNGWATCTSVEEFLYRSPENGSGYVQCCYGTKCAGYTLCSDTRYCTAPCEGDVYQKGNYYYTDIRSPHTTQAYCTNEDNGGLTSIANYNSCYAYLRCTDECEAEQKQCELSGGRWVPSEEEGECGYCDNDTTDVCAEFRAQCKGAGGSFSGTEYNTSTGKCCSASCNLCNNESAEKIRSQKTKECCAQNMAPPDPLLQCYTPLESGCGMSQSKYSDETNDWSCRDPNLSTEAFNSFYRECGNSSSSNEEESSSSECEGEGCEGPPGSSSSSNEGPESSSSDDDVGPNSSTDGSGCEECQLLEEAIDTLHLIHLSIDDIYYCLSSPYLCTSNKVDDSNDPFQFDTAFRRYLRPLMDSMLKVDSNQLKALVKLDTNTLKMLRNDTTTRTVIEGGFSSLEDTTRKWFKRIADSIGVSTSELAAHIDSIIRHIPDSVLDSIVKYQQYATDNFDSVLYGHGKGFSLVDSLIDSAVRYFQLSHHYDSMYNLMFRDSLGSINQSVDRVPIATAGAVNSVFGYGDTASSTLRGDLNGIKDAIEGIGDGIGSGVAGSLDSAIRSGGGADTSGVSYGWLEDGERLGDSIINGSGFGGLDFAADSALRDSLASVGWLCNNDSCCVGSECVYFDSDSLIDDSLTRYVTRMGDSIKEYNNTYLEDSTTSLFQEVKDSLVAFNPLGIFDSTLLSTLGAKIPNSNTCPDHCSKFEVDIPFSFGTRHFTIDYGLCLGRAVFANGNILSFLRFIIRLIIAITCISAVMWNASRIRR